MGWRCASNVVLKQKRSVFETISMLAAKNSAADPGEPLLTFGVKTISLSENPASPTFTFTHVIRLAQEVEGSVVYDRKHASDAE